VAGRLGRTTAGGRAVGAALFHGLFGRGKTKERQEAKSKRQKTKVKTVNTGSCGAELQVGRSAEVVGVGWDSDWWLHW
jgi:hypothetical protein